MIADNDTEPGAEIPPDSSSPDRLVIPRGYRLLFLLVVFDSFLLAGHVWFMAWRIDTRIKAGEWMPGDEFIKLFMAFHVVFLLLALVAYLMQSIRSKYNTLALFPVALVIATLVLNVLDLQLRFLLKM
ncbi:MAG: hypothetical protein ABIC40_06305 [bacterium]